jgi:glycosyltransferase involved in cell wall biosynthesis
MASLMRTPKVSVITVCFNAAASIERTILSVRSQTHDAIEHVVVDGASTDGTMDIVRRHADGIATIVSEKDGGIFDAMNKGIGLSTGDIVYFLNADDTFVDDRVVADAVAAFTADPVRSLVYGNVLLKGAPEGTGNFFAKPFITHSVSEFLNNSFCHQAVFVKRELFATFGLFDCDYRYSADYEWICRAFKAKRGSDFHFIDRDIAWYYFLGRSAQNMAVTFNEVNRIQSRHFLSLEYAWYFFRYVWIRRWKKRLLNESGWLLQQRTAPNRRD